MNANQHELDNQGRTNVDKKTIAAAFAGASILTFAGMADAADVKVMASAALREAYLELVPQFERSTEHKVATTWAGTVEIMKRMQAGETFDLVIMAGPDRRIDQARQDRAGQPGRP